MASNNYNAYNYPYQQSAAQQYPAYHTTPAPSNVAQSSRPYQQPNSTQGSDHMSYSGSSYGAQASGYCPSQDNTWSGNSYGNTRETTRGAAEVLHNMSNDSYAPNNTSAPTQVQAQNPHGTNSAYGHSQVHPRSVNANQTQVMTSRGLPSPAATAGYPSQRAQNVYNQQQEHSASPAQHQYNATPASSTKFSVLPAVSSQPYNDYNSRKLPGVEPARPSQPASNSTPYNHAAQPASTSTSYNHTGSHISGSTPPLQATNATVAETYSNAPRATTVDPSAVYDPYADIQRRAEIARAQKALEDAARAEEERIAEQARKEERIAEQARKAEQLKAEEARKRQEEEERLRRPQPKPKAQKSAKEQSSTAEVAAAETPSDTPEALEAAMRAMMAKMRELNSKDPALLARIWEEERRGKAPKSPTMQDKPAPQVPPALTAQPVPLVSSVQASATPIANSRKKTVPREPTVPPVARTASPAQPPVTVARPHAHAASNRPGGTTIWPPEKRAQLANAAVSFLAARNPTFNLDSNQILSMLNSNPSYIQLCEQLEQLGLKLDRAAFAKSLLTAVPDVNSGSRKTTSQPTPVSAHRPMVPPAVMKKEVATPATTAGSPQHTPAVASPANNDSQTPLPAAPVPVAEMIPIKAELKPPANKEEAARKRNLSDLIDLTQLSDDEDFGPPMKRHQSDVARSLESQHPHVQDVMRVDAEPNITNFPIAHISRPVQEPVYQPVLPPNEEFRNQPIVKVLDKKKALRRNNYNPATIARDVLLACGRHPSERQLNQHLDGLRATLGIVFESDLSTLRWDILDPGTPPPGYFKDSVEAWTGDADDEDESEDESRPRASLHATSGEGGASKVQALPAATNPFKQKRRGRPPRHSYPANTAPTTPDHVPSTADMSSSATHPSSATAGIGYHAFRSATQYGPDGQPLPKKKGRPIGWRKAIHGSAAARIRPPLNGHTGPFNSHQPPHSSSLRNVKTDANEPIRIDSRSPTVARRVPQLQSYKCLWKKCEAELHNLETLKKHVFKVHRIATPQNTLECSWGDCGKEVANHDTMTNMIIDEITPHSFDRESEWRQHIQESHFDPLSWELGDGPASGLSDAHDSDAYLSDAQGRQVTPRITVKLDDMPDLSLACVQSPGPRGRGRPPKISPEQEALDTHARLVSRIRRIGGPGMDRGGATLVNDKRRRGFLDNSDVEGELVDADD
ncbi:hypothetical protein LEMA_P054140.1 [Plenodomus lingam JN3]|uniref:C2H2-type domain-containing protein n=1 Tax=Leptosphaeria maculans (strain JN3 / isolate v23.1.3 / race Av1-4-5-6-7-8) TaxID=985895 RepID=E4ZLM8_LEPMJ|nr:hypothetical protein LEMA_P054140.1 [Plenodomus lingam JN3]CBX92708.1 hypothetical protein LEMA_P054140.1 [Plenodomus lingam JN3]